MVRCPVRHQEKMIIYNLFPTLAGRFADWQPHLSRAAAMGFNWVFVNPIQPPGSSGSLYSIADYFAINPVLADPGGKKDVEVQAREAIKAAEKMGLKLMVDLVISHCAVDSELLRVHPEWFQWEGKGRVAHPFCYENGNKVVWRDLAKFDHKNTKDKQGLGQFLFDVVKYLLALGFKGFRCDAAYQVPGRIWKRLIQETKKQYPEVLFFAETLGCPPDLTRKTASAGFDYIFNSSKWWDFQSQWLLKQYALTRDIAPSVSFPESHDTERLCAELDGNLDGVKQRYLFAALFSSGVMMPIGFEFGFRNKPDVVKTRPQNWEQTDIDLTAYITRVNGIKAAHAIFQEEAPTEILPHPNPNVLFLWKASVKTPEEVLLVLNKDIHHHQPFYVENFQEYVQAGAGSVLVDISPEYAMEFLPKPFAYDLRPGQGIVLITSRRLGTEGV
jgi:starch synthase (maltosyl-transferring)